MVVGIVGIIVAAYTLIKIERQTVAIEQQTKLQSVQWVALKNWRSSRPRPDWLKIEVDVFNETSFPLTLIACAFRFGSIESHSILHLTVTPGAYHTLDFNRTLLPDEVAAYATNCTVFGIRGAITFTGVGGRVTQPFGGLISASQSSSTIFRPEGAYEQSAKEHYGEKEPRENPN